MPSLLGLFLIREDLLTGILSSLDGRVGGGCLGISGGLVGIDGGVIVGVPGGVVHSLLRGVGFGGGIGIPVVSNVLGPTFSG